MRKILLIIVFLVILGIVGIFISQSEYLYALLFFLCALLDLRLVLKKDNKEE